MSFVSFASFTSFTLARSFLNQYFSTRSLSTSIMADITTIAALYLLYKSQKLRKTTRRCIWVDEVLRRHTELGEFHCLLQELRLDDDRYHRLTRAQFEDLLARVSARISRLDTNYRRSISAVERSSICLRWVAVSAAHTQLQLLSPSSLLWATKNNRTWGKWRHQLELAADWMLWCDAAWKVGYFQHYLRHSRCFRRFIRTGQTLQTLHLHRARRSIRTADAWIVVSSRHLHWFSM